MLDATKHFSGASCRIKFRLAREGRSAKPLGSARGGVEILVGARNHATGDRFFQSFLQARMVFTGTRTTSAQARFKVAAFLQAGCGAAGLGPEITGVLA